MSLQDLLCGIAVVIDDKVLDRGTDEPLDRLLTIVEDEWHLPCYKATKLPRTESWPDLLGAASLVFLDWNLWGASASTANEMIRSTKDFLAKAAELGIPVVIVTNEALDDVSHDLYGEDRDTERGLVLVRQKAELLQDPPFESVLSWIRRHPSAYVLKEWEKRMFSAKLELFRALYARSPDWPLVFWRAYERDGVDPAGPLSQLIKDNLWGRIGRSLVSADAMTGGDATAEAEEIRALIGEASFVPNDLLPDDQAGCGDLFGYKPKGGRTRLLLNLRPDCDCVARGNAGAGAVKLYCITGERMSDEEIEGEFDARTSAFKEKIAEAIVFAIHEGATYRFKFGHLHVKTFGDLMAGRGRVGRLLHPYLTRIQQRYALYSQRQALPPIPFQSLDRSAASPPDP